MRKIKDLDEMLGLFELLFNTTSQLKEQKKTEETNKKENQEEFRENLYSMHKQLFRENVYTVEINSKNEEFLKLLQEKEIKINEPIILTKDKLEFLENLLHNCKVEYYKEKYKTSRVSAGGNYFFIQTEYKNPKSDYQGVITRSIKERTDKGTDLDNYLFDTHNYFHTKEEAEKNIII